MRTNGAEDDPSNHDDAACWRMLKGQDKTGKGRKAWQEIVETQGVLWRPYIPQFSGIESGKRHRIMHVSMLIITHKSSVQWNAMVLRSKTEIITDREHA